MVKALIQIYLLYHYFESKLFVLKKLVLYADNCGAQNKNNFTFWFFDWYLRSHPSIEEIEINLLISGHTKFSPDRHFGYAKKAFNSHDNIETYLDAIKIIENSANNQIIIPIRDFRTKVTNVHVYD